MGKLEELEALDRIMKDGQSRVVTVKNNIDILDKEIATLTQLEQTLMENLKCLKENNIIAMASEFKKAKEDLSRTKARLISQQNERADYHKALDHVNKVMEESRITIEKLKKSGENNVLRGKFGKKENG